MSALLLKADISNYPVNICFVPEADIGNTEDTRARLHVTSQSAIRPIDQSLERQTLVNCQISGDGRD
jgi:hypothetical protein